MKNLQTYEMLDLFKRAKLKIYQKKNWTQKTFARDAKQEPVEPTSSEAKCWCGLGALYAVTYKHPMYKVEDVRDALFAEAKIYTLASVNDDNNLGPDKAHKKVMQIFNRAINSLQAKLEAEEKSNA